MDENLYKLKTDGLKIIHKIQGFIQFSYFGNSDINTTILNELNYLESIIKKIFGEP